MPTANMACTNGAALNPVRGTELPPRGNGPDKHGSGRCPVCNAYRPLDRDGRVTPHKPL